ncbi:MAG: hypothetical protein LUH58_02300 [Lachnospiraceae bacterium]|nr:hypothetical protein [Lachnospiraceae bacterium]
MLFSSSCGIQLPLLFYCTITKENGKVNRNRHQVFPTVAFVHCSGDGRIQEAMKAKGITSCALAEKAAESIDEYIRAKM